MPASVQSGQFRPQQAFHVDTSTNGMGAAHPTYHGETDVAPYRADNNTTAGARMAWKTNSLGRGTPAPYSAKTAGTNVNFDPPEAPKGFVKP